MREQSYSNKINSQQKRDFRGGETKVMKKRLNILLVFALVLSLLTPAFAFAAEAELTTEAKFETLKEAGVMSGYADGTAGLDQPMKRGEVAKVLANIYKLEVVPSAASDFDEPQDSSFYTEGYIQAVVAAGLMTGGTNDEGMKVFQPNKNLSLEELAVVLVNALDLDTNADATVEGKTSAWGTAAVAAAIEAGLLDSSDDYKAQADRAALVEGSYAAKVAYDEANVPETLEVVSVKAPNLKQLEVVFNKEVSEAGDETNYKLDADTATITANSDFTLSADKKTVVITLDAAAENQDKVDLTVKGIDKLEESTVEGIEFLDTTIPTALKSEVVGNDTIKVYFSEPIEMAPKSAFEVDGGDYFVKDATLVNNGYEANVELYSTLEEGKVTIEVTSGVEDYAGFGVVKTSLDATVVVDEEAPVVVDYKDATPNAVTLIFNEDVELTDADEVNFYHTNTNNTADVAGVEVDGKELTLDFTGNTLPEGTAYVYIAEKSVNDLWDNLNAKIVYAVEVEIDTTKPTLDEIESDTEDQIVLTFSEDLDDAEEENFTILDSEGKEVENIINDVTLAGDEVTIDFDEDLSGDYSIVVKGLEDLAGNVIADITKDFTVDDSTAPAFADFTATIYKAGQKGQLVKVSFDEKMAVEGKYSVLDADKYVFGTTKLADVENVEFTVVDNGTAVEITIPSEADEEEGVNLVAGAGILKLARVADAVGNYTSDLSGTVDLDAPGTVAIESIEATDVDTIVVTFGDLLDSFDADDIAFTYATTETLTIGKVKTSLDSKNNTVATFTLGQDLNTNGTVTDAVYTAENPLAITVVADPASENVYGETLATGDVTPLFEDKIAPALATNEVDGEDVDDVQIAGNTIVLTFTEDIAANSVSTVSFEVEELDVTLVSVVDNVVTLTLDAAAEVGTKVTQKAAIKDAAGNSVSGINTEVAE